MGQNKIVSPFGEVLRTSGDRELVRKYVRKGESELALALEDAKRLGINPELITLAEKRGMEDGSLDFVYVQDVLEKEVLKRPELEEYRRYVQPYLSPEANERILKRMAPFIYERLDERVRKDLSRKAVLTYILNIGFIRLPRISHRSACDYIVKYAPLFANETDALDSIIERFLEEELACTPIDETKAKVEELRQQVAKIYEGVA